MERERNMFSNVYPGLLLSFSGIDFCGKSTQATRISQWLKAHLADRMTDVFLTKQPTQGHFGRKIRSILADKRLFKETDPFDLQELFAKDSRMHCEKEISPWLERGHIVCADRFRESMVYGAERNNVIDLHMLMEMNRQYHRRYWVWPHKVFVFDLPSELAIERGRISGRKFDEMEKLETLERVRDNFHMFAREYPDANLCFVDASHSVEEVFVDVRKELEVLLKRHEIRLE